VVKLDLRCRCPWQVHSERLGAGVEVTVRSLVVLYNHSVLLLLSSDGLMSCAAGTNGCLDLKCQTFPLGGHVSTAGEDLGEGKVSTCPGASKLAFMSRETPG